IQASVLLGAIAAGTRQGTEYQALARYGAELGLAFQIQDDVLDVLGETATLGKIAGADAARGKPTYPSVLGLAESQRLARHHCEAAVAALAGLGTGAVPLAQLADYVVNRSN
ncbi:MAG TPA: polyprenyl synthetase family protein, partial [Steroidobacteraceae bacterium]|nr:polyprenyl synthetase family protein [Steroidobacteraceae bacterium]